MNTAALTRTPTTLLYGNGDRVLWRGYPATVTGIGWEYGSIVYDVLLDDGEHRQRWAYQDQLEPLVEMEAVT